MGTDALSRLQKDVICPIVARNGTTREVFLGRSSLNLFSKKDLELTARPALAEGKFLGTTPKPYLITIQGTAHKW